MYGRSLDTDGNNQEPLAWLQGIEYQECHGVLSSRNMCSTWMILSGTYPLRVGRYTCRKDRYLCQLEMQDIGTSTFINAFELSPVHCLKPRPW